MFKLTVTVLLLVVALILTIPAARCPLWVPLLLVIVVELLHAIPLG